MVPGAKGFLFTSPRPDSEIGQGKEDRVADRREWEGLRRLQPMPELVRRRNQRRVGSPYVLMALPADDTPSAAQIEARRAVGEGQQGRRGTRITRLHEDAPDGPVRGGWR